ncbi:hypothetical protein E3N88_09517 [Mikania micrantha]|uniref:Uncharacterized protein n=1 Tax=Mikania micrantha TaxID=192012 RepID=A0A5N6PL85_9ASTR|nr:hypothetical protein E3N88_09517 [Mikania micrantha]
MLKHWSWALGLLSGIQLLYSWRGNFQPFGPQPNPIFGPPPNPPPLHNPPRTPQRYNQGSSDTQSTHLNRHDVPSHRANSLYQEDNIRGRVDDWDDGVVNEGDQRYQGGWDNDNHDEGYGYQGHQHYAHPNPRYLGQPRIPRRPNVNQHPDGGYDRYEDGVPRAPNRGIVQADIVDGCLSHESGGDIIEMCFACDRDELSMVKDMEEEDRKMEVLMASDGRPPWTIQVESLPDSIDSKLNTLFGRTT